MNKQLLLLLVILSIVQACHNSCATCNQNVCLSCNGEHQEIVHARACRCVAGYYAEQLNPLSCKEIISGNAPDACEREIAVNMYNLEVLTLCYYSTENDNGQKNYVVSDVSINEDHSQLGAFCRDTLKTQIQYRPKGNDDSRGEDYQYIDFPSQYISDLPNGKAGDKRLKIPLIDIYGLAYFQKIVDNGNQILQDVYFRVLIGHQRKVIRSHRWLMTVYTNRQQIQTFVIDVDIQRTESCQDGQECIIIADLDVTGKIYESNFSVVRGNNLFVVGDWLYLRIWFKDATYTKQLSFQKLYYKNDQSQVFDHTSLTDPNETKWNSGDKSLHVKLRLIEPGQGAVVQVNMLIETADARLRRILQSDNPVKQQFKVDVLSPMPTQSDNANSDSDKQASGFMMFFGLLNLLALIFFY